ncbi:similar to Saccharomyces cerevisiae YBR137W Protein of unknown function [Maudiozyma barnettii]|uniref:Uncharacterized protein n=1 Tax=Maudiozyma barnettii TaxID=61262 RepID=A0A8H2VDD9_9SACH|nr:hypothetical protein [Kazachstania barnettii]CAB4253213.1 similar to Saccharomyces cerevisiae YBR137W Protein of unknown function [Kazachstania barnettii]CAD1780251.1 similar to Saccharomyces cerevisiae YBR137W Protein of unknown function [Kazachstania barnettii]
MINNTRDISILQQPLDDYLSKDLSLGELEVLESQTSLPKFDDETAFELGCFIRAEARKMFPDKCITIDISLPSRHCLFRCTSINGSSLDNTKWVERKQNTVFRFNHSTFFIRQKKGDIPMEQRFFISAEEYAFHGGAVPLFVDNVSSPIACLTISGLKQEQDHFLATTALLHFKKLL